MPRPKRSKVAPSAPIKLPHQRVSQQPVTASAAQKQKDLFSPPSSGRGNNTSDDSDGLVVARRAGRAKTNVIPQEYTMSGALAVEDLGTSSLKPLSSKTRAELMRITRDAEYAQASQGVGARGANIQEPRAEAEDPEQIPSSFPEEPTLTRHDLHRSSSKQTPMRQSIYAQLGSKLQATPRVTSLTMGHSAFKKRARQPSLLQVAQSQHQTLLDVDDDNDDLYNFLPDDESTPVIKATSQPHAQPRSSSLEPASVSRKRKRSTPEVQVPASQFQSQASPPRSPSVSSPTHIIEQDDLSALFPEEGQSQPSLPRHPATQTPPPQILSDTLAPPQSSSPAKPKPEAAQGKSIKPSHRPKLQTKQRKRKEQLPAQSPLSSASAQISPVRPVKTKPLTTASLQNMLPRRRVRGRPKGDYDVPSSSDLELDNTGLGEDEDELSFHATKVRRKKSGMNVPKRGANKKEAVSKTTRKTYARKSITVSEDEDDENDSISGGDEGNENIAGRGKKASGLDSKAKAEMKRLAQKFREVDEYTLDFEDMTGSSSQMKDAR